MVISSSTLSDSTSTLTSLDPRLDDSKDVNEFAEEESPQEYSYWEDADDEGCANPGFYVTPIQLPLPEDVEHREVRHGLKRSLTSQSFLSLPSVASNESLNEFVHGSTAPPSPSPPQPLDSYLASIPYVRARSMALLQQKPVWYDGHSRERLVYVRQGEVAHATGTQCDVLVSDKATTCHILALYSTSSRRECLGSLAHIDGPSYNDCVRDMIRCHQAHHGPNLGLDVHVLGGFVDEQGSSRDLTDWLIRTIAHVVSEEGHQMTVTLKTAAVTSMNHSHSRAPVGRGLALDLRKGTTFLAACAATAVGPDPIIRSLRFWSSDATAKNRLHVIHEPSSCGSEIRIAPFRYSAPRRVLDWLLSLSDAELLRCTSTSPDCEEADFCVTLRASLRHLRTVPDTHVFGPHANRVRIYRRDERNVWIRQPDEVSNPNSKNKDGGVSPRKRQVLATTE
jgi:hypothetical protein